MINEGPLWVCDSCTLIDLITNDVNYKSALDKIRTMRANGEIVLGVSEITVAECCKLTQKHGQDPVNVFEKVEAYLAMPNTRRLPVTPPVSARAAVLIRLFRLDTCDAIIVGSALARGQGLYTRDSSSLCKRIRSSQCVPCLAKNELDKMEGTWPDEKDVLEELKHLNIVEIKPDIPKSATVPMVPTPETSKSVAST